MLEQSHSRRAEVCSCIWNKRARGERTHNMLGARQASTFGKEGVQRTETPYTRAASPHLLLCSRISTIVIPFNTFSIVRSTVVSGREFNLRGLGTEFPLARITSSKEILSGSSPKVYPPLAPWCAPSNPAS